MASDRISPLTYLLMPTLATLFFWAVAGSDHGFSSLLVSYGLLLAAWASFQRWIHRMDSNFPLFCVICGLHWLYFALPLFLGEDTVKMYQFMDVVLTDEPLQLALLLVAWGVLFLLLGLSARIGRYLAPKRVVDLIGTPYALEYTRVVLALGIILNTMESAPYLLGSGLRQLVTVLQATIPLVAFSICLRRWFHGDATRVDRFLVIAFVLVRFMLGMASGWLGSVVGVLAVMGVVYLGERRKLPIQLLICFFAIFIFLQAGKEDFRRTYWRSSIEAGKLDRATAWINTSWEAWEEALQDPSGDLFRTRLLSVMSRVSLLPQTANVIELTPRVVPYQGIGLYSYFAVTLIPRAIWRNKPSINEANQFYQVAYGLTTEENLETVSIAVGFLTEGYIVWGWAGTAIVMFLVGIFYDLFQQTFLSRRRGIFFQAIGAALLLQLAGIEGQLAQYLGGLAQQIVVAVVVFLPVLEVRTVSGRQASESQRQPLAASLSIGAETSLGSPSPQS